jgi:hypothetical protein
VPSSSSFFFFKTVPTVLLECSFSTTFIVYKNCHNLILILFWNIFSKIQKNIYILYIRVIFEMFIPRSSIIFLV